MRYYYEAKCCLKTYVVPYSPQGPAAGNLFTMRKLFNKVKNLISIATLLFRSLRVPLGENREQLWFKIASLL
jgi:hypothetical protein